MVRVVGIHHLALVTGSLDPPLRFWCDLVGLRVRSRFGSPDYRQYILAAGGQTLPALFEWSGAEPVPEKDHGVPQRGPIAFDPSHSNGETTRNSSNCVTDSSSRNVGGKRERALLK